MEVRDEVLGFLVENLGVRVGGLNFRGQGSGITVSGSGLKGKQPCHLSIRPVSRDKSLGR